MATQYARLVLLSCCPFLAMASEAVPESSRPASAANEPERLPSLLEQIQLPIKVAELYKQSTEFFKQGRYKESHARAQKSVAICRFLYPKKQFPRGHNLLAQCLNNLGMVLTALGNYGEASRSLEEALPTMQWLFSEKTYPQGHPDLAKCLNNLGTLRRAQGKYGEAKKHLEEALKVCRRLFPVATYPLGHIYLARSLNNLGTLCQDLGYHDNAMKYYEEAYTMGNRLFPKGHEFVARCSNNLGVLYEARGEFGKAREYHEKAVAGRRSLYPHGHPDLATSLSNLGALLNRQGEYGKSRQYYEEAFQLRRRLYPQGDYPQGHPSLAANLHRLGAILKAQGNLREALNRHEEALRMRRSLYPDGHPDLAYSLKAMAEVLEAQGESAKVKKCMKEALEICRRLYPRYTYPKGHPDLVHFLNNVGVVFLDHGEFNQARAHLREALEIATRLYSKKSYPIGHPLLASINDNLGYLCHIQGKFEEAIPFLTAASDMEFDLAESFFALSSEAEALNFIAKDLGLIPHMLLSAWRHTTKTADELYAHVWARRGLIQDLMASRQRVLLDHPDPDVRDRYKHYLSVRRRLARITMARAEAGSEQATRRQLELRRLVEERERLEREHGRELAEVHRGARRTRRSHQELAEELPEGTAFIDFVYYMDMQRNKVPFTGGDLFLPWYCGFIVLPGKQVVRVDVGPAERIDSIVLAWRKDIQEGRTSAGPARLNFLLWEYVRQRIPDTIRTVYICPDGRLTALPWAALTGRHENSVLLEDHAIATVPSGRFLLEQLSRKRIDSESEGLLLAVGDVSYDKKPELTTTDITLRGPAGRGGGKWLSLPFSEEELHRVIALAGKRPSIRLSRQKASTHMVLRHLPEARFAHFATHGFFASLQLRSKLQLDPKAFETWPGTHLWRKDRRSVSGRSPLLLSGLVLAGANLEAAGTVSAAELPGGGILAAEAIAGLPLGGLKLAVLSACDTGLGELAAGEGVFSLQRAFHQAGTENVVVSLWKVEDEATAALMSLFYHYLWKEEKSPLQALREAQLWIYRHPKKFQRFAGMRGDLEVTKLVKLPGGGRVEPEPTVAPTRLWASFLVSGAGK